MSTKPLLLRGFAPLVLGAVLFLLSVLLVPSNAPERVVLEPVGSTTTSSTTSTTATTSTTVVPPP